MDGLYPRGEFEIAAFQTMRAVEVAVRGAAGYGNEKYGVSMMHEAFSAGKGPLGDMSANSGEQVARMDLFAGAIGCQHYQRGGKVLLDFDHPK
jgi:hypothetical protein